MKKLIFSLLAFISLGAVAQTAEEVVANFSKAMGTLDSFNRVKTAKITGITVLNGQEFPLTIYIINGRAVRTELNVMGQEVVSAYKDGKGWSVNPLTGASTATDVEGTMLQDLKIQSSLASMLMDYKKHGHTIELQGQENIEGINTHKIKLIASDSRVTTYYISTNDYSLIKSTTTRDMMGQTMQVETWYSNLKDYSGLKIYMDREMKTAGQVFQTLRFKTVELNVPIDEKIFDKQ